MHPAIQIIPQPKNCIFGAFCTGSKYHSIPVVFFGGVKQAENILRLIFAVSIHDYDTTCIVLRQPVAKPQCYCPLMTNISLEVQNPYGANPAMHWVSYAGKRWW